MTDAHPARSTEFLSRLYDGELDAAENAAFAAHRSGCDECRRAADVFAATLAAFRSQPTAPPSPDLSARILRRIRAQSPSRRPFGVTFGIDVRWAGVFAAALLVVLISAPLVFRRPPVTPAPNPAAISAHLQDETPAAPAPSAETRNERRPEAAAQPRSAEVPPAPSVLAKDEAAANAAPAAPPSIASRAEAPADEEKRRVGLAPPLRQKSAADAPRRATESVGGEAGAGTALDFAAPVPRLFVLAADGGGTPPPILTRPDAPRLSALRGREFVLLVETGGRVRSVASAGSAAAPGAEADVLRQMVFGPGDRPRRLSVRVE
jgi:hypothetical protein